MADLDGDLQGGTAGIAPSSAYSAADFTQRDGDLQKPQSGEFFSDVSSCTCEVGATSIHTVSITAFADHLEVKFSDNVVLSGPALDIANWFVTNPGPALGREVVVGAITSVVGDTVTLAVSPQTLNANYRLYLPTIGISSTSFGIFTGLFSLDFLGVPTFVSIQMVKAVDTHRVDVIFAIAVDETTASDPLNYSVNNGLTITSATKITDFWYRLRNDPRQTDGVTYTFIATNIEPR
jgi:hypothetical protein